jgi:hypothetical protein
MPVRVLALGAAEVLRALRALGALRVPGALRAPGVMAVVSPMPLPAVVARRLAVAPTLPEAEVEILPAPARTPGVGVESPGATPTAVRHIRRASPCLASPLLASLAVEGRTPRNGQGGFA